MSMRTGWSSEANLEKPRGKIFFWYYILIPTTCVSRYKIRDCNSKRKIGERLKVFEEFVSLFDDSQQHSILAADTVT